MPGFKAPPRRVLIVDDNREAADSLAMILRANGHETGCVYSASDALLQAEGFHPDVILLDIGLPGMNGYEVAQQLRERPSLRDVRLIAVTGYGRAEDRQQAREAGFDQHLVKPVGPELLERALAGVR